MSKNKNRMETCAEWARLFFDIIFHLFGLSTAVASTPIL